MFRREFKTCIRILLALAAMVAAPKLLAAQEQQPPKPMNLAIPGGTAIAESALQISPGDLLDIAVFDVPELTQQVRVGSDGEVQLALIGNTSLAGLTEHQAAEKIAHELHDRNFLIEPQVKVSIKESTTQGISVLGEVQHPGIYQIVGSRTLLDVLSMAGGLTNIADTRITIKHRSTAKDSVTVNLKNDDPKISLDVDRQVYPGDMVLVPRAGVVYVLGEVTRPGGYVMQNNGKITVLEALAQAGSISAGAASNHAVLLRKIDDDYTTSRLNIDKIARGKERDFELHANDIVFIPNARLKSAFRNTSSAVGMAASIGSVAIYGIMH